MYIVRNLRTIRRVIGIAMGFILMLTPASVFASTSPSSIQIAAATVSADAQPVSAQPETSRPGASGEKEQMYARGTFRRTYRPSTRSSAPSYGSSYGSRYGFGGFGSHMFSFGTGLFLGSMFHPFGGYYGMGGYYGYHGFSILSLLFDVLIIYIIWRIIRRFIGRR